MLLLGLFLIVLSVPFFSFSGDLRLECILNNTNGCSVYNNTQIVSLATMTIGMLLAILSRPGGTGIKAIDDFDEGKEYDSFVAGFDDEPSSDAIGILKDGYEWLEYPVGSDSWYTRPETSGPWAKYRG